MPVTYATSTYNVVLRWKEDTKIEYKANPKLVGSKSHVRYEKYSKAKTVGDALKFGSYSLDLLFDHQHGHLRQAGGPTRRAPVLPKDLDESSTKTDRVVASMNQKWITWSSTFEVAERLGVDRRNLSADKLGGESIEMHAHRMEAQAVAQLLLDEAAKRHKKITGADVLTVLRLWEFRQSTSRQNVMKEGIEWVHSDTLGLLSSYDGAVLVSNATKHYPAVPRIMCQWLRDNRPSWLGRDFCFTSINVNHGYGARLHRDGNNEGASLIQAFGDFTGGELLYWPEDDKSKHFDTFKEEDAVKVDLKKNLLLFDGNRGHAVTEFEGERYTLVFFCIGKSFKATADHRSKLKECGVDVPEAKDLEWAKSLLSAPRGNGTAPRAKDAKAPWMSWPAKADKGSVVSLLSQEQLDQAKVQSRQVEAPADDDGAIHETGFKKFRFDRFKEDNGVHHLRVLLHGQSGQVYCAVEGKEVKAGCARFQYEKRESFPLGEPLSTYRLSDVRAWLAIMVPPKVKGPAAKKNAGQALGKDSKRKAAAFGGRRAVATPARAGAAAAEAPKAALKRGLSSKALQAASAKRGKKGEGKKAAKA